MVMADSWWNELRFTAALHFVMNHLVLGKRCRKSQPCLFGGRTGAKGMSGQYSVCVVRENRM